MKTIKYCTEMLIIVYFYYILSIYSKIISKTSNFNDKTHFTCVYVSCKHIEDVTFWCILIQTNPVFVKFCFRDPVFKFTFDRNTSISEVQTLALFRFMVQCVQEFPV